MVNITLLPSLRITPAPPDVHPGLCRGKGGRHRIFRDTRR
jgi:hypothetical protein